MSLPKEKVVKEQFLKRKNTYIRPDSMFDDVEYITARYNGHTKIGLKDQETFRQAKRKQFFFNEEDKQHYSTSGLLAKLTEEVNGNPVQLNCWVRDYITVHLYDGSVMLLAELDLLHRVENTIVFEEDEDEEDSDEEDEDEEDERKAEELRRQLVLLEQKKMMKKRLSEAPIIRQRRIAELEQQKHIRQKRIAELEEQKQKYLGDISIINNKQKYLRDATDREIILQEMQREETAKKAEQEWQKHL